MTSPETPEENTKLMGTEIGGLAGIVTTVGVGQSALYAGRMTEDGAAAGGR